MDSELKRGHKILTHTGGSVFCITGWTWSTTVRLSNSNLLGDIQVETVLSYNTRTLPTTGLHFLTVVSY